MNQIDKAATAERRMAQSADVMLGDDYVSPDALRDLVERKAATKRGWFAINTSPLARKIITFNLLGLIVLLAGILYLNPSRDSLALQRAGNLVAEAELVADIIEMQMGNTGDSRVGGANGLDVAQILRQLDLYEGTEVYVFDGQGNLITVEKGLRPHSEAQVRAEGKTYVTDGLEAIWGWMVQLFSPTDEMASALRSEDIVRDMIGGARIAQTRMASGVGANGETIFTVATPIEAAGVQVGAVAIASATGEIDRLVSIERERVLRMFIVALIVSIGLSLVLASTIANPLSDLAAAAEIGRDRNRTRYSPGRVRIPDLSARPDEIGRLSEALRGMVAALYERIDSNEQFAADVAHEIKNPLASLRSAVGTLRVARRPEQQEQLLDVIEHDVRRLDRLVSDISNASRLDSELVREDEEQFNLLQMLGNLIQYLGEDARGKGIDFISDLPEGPVIIQGLEARLAQVFVNLITNAISFCEEGDAIRVWARQRDNRVLVVVEDTGPGIPEQSLTKIFKRFYSHRPVGQFGNNSGLGLAISKQIVEAHGGVIWAENIRQPQGDLDDEPLGARFVVGLPL